MTLAGRPISGSSNAPARTTTRPGRLNASLNSGVPHRGQKRRRMAFPLSAVLTYSLTSPVSLKLSGWVEELHVKATGDAVEEGDPLFELYSPELLEAQRNYLLALSARESVPERASADTKATRSCTS